MLLKKLIKNIPEKKKETLVKGLATNSKNVKKGFIFFAIRGQKLNGERYINEAVKKGAVAIVCSKLCKYTNRNIQVIKTSNIRALLSEVSSKFFKLKPKNILAVTGTNGKTSVADLFYQILSINKIPVASIGTLGIKYDKKLIKSKLTSPDTILLHQSLQKIKKNKIDNVIIETSSHGLHQNRIDHLNLKAGIFTNFSQDHLDYHKTMKAYLNSKLILFKDILSPNKSIVSDKSNKEFSILKKISRIRKLRLIDINKTKEKLKKKIKRNLYEFQLKNLSMAIEAAKLCNIGEKKIFNVIHKIKDVDGRFELVKIFPNNVKVYVDFAHTPDALLKTIKALKNLDNGIVSIVFGCGGERDFRKRPSMAKIANSYCRKIYVTDDNPRNENPVKIRKEIIKHIEKSKCFNIGDRSKAIKTAVQNSEPNEIILIAGKGHETEQIYRNKIILNTDKQIIKNLKIKKKKLSKNIQAFIQNKKIFMSIKKNFKIKNFHGLSIDTRVIKKKNLFLTIKGQKTDGLKFVSEALKKGASFIVSSKKIKKHRNKVIKVENETKFLNRFALEKRKNCNAKIIAITGSAGKTSLKNLIKDILSNFGETLCSPKSYNNHLGVPLSLSDLKPSHKYAVFEVGMSKAGEINALSKLVSPHCAIITNIGEAHIENFKNLKGIADAKGEIINNIRRGGTLILNRDDRFFEYLKKKAKLKDINIVSFGMSTKSDIYPTKISKNKKTIKFKIKTKNQILKLEMKDLNLYNILSSLALLKVLNLSVNKIKKYYKNYELTEGRGKIHKIKRYNKKFKLIDESYNANPLSVKNAIKNFKSIKKQNFKKYLLLGDMLELGNHSEYLHKDLAKVINNSDIDKVFIKGTNTPVTYKNLVRSKRGNIIQHEEDVDFTLNNIIANNDYLMIKGSHATGLNNLTKKMIKEN